MYVSLYTINYSIYSNGGDDEADQWYGGLHKLLEQQNSSGLLPVIQSHLVREYPSGIYKRFNRGDYIVGMVGVGRELGASIIL